MVTGLFYTTTNHVTFVPHSRNGQSQCSPKLREIRAAHIAQLHAFQVVPDALVGIQIRCVTWQPLKMNALGTAIGQELFDRFATMNRRAVPNHQQLARDVAEQMFQEADDILAAIGTLLGHQQEGVVHSDATNRRYMVPSERHAQDRGLTTRRIGAHETGQEIEARFVYPDDRSTFFLSPFFSAGQRSVYQASMAASSRWVARRIGFWTLQPMSLRSREI